MDWDRPADCLRIHSHPWAVRDSHGRLEVWLALALQDGRANTARTHLWRPPIFGATLQLPLEMSTRKKPSGALRVCIWAALVSLLVTAILPFLFFRFPGPERMPFRYEHMCAVTELLWKPLRLLQVVLDPLVAQDLHEQWNPYYAAPLVNLLAAFVLTHPLLKLWNHWRNRKRTADAGSIVHALAGHIGAIRADHAAALQSVPHPTVHAESVLEEAREKVASRGYFKREQAHEVMGRRESVEHPPTRGN